MIEHSRSPYVFSEVFVPKKSGELRMTIDYRVLNKKTIASATVLPHLDQMKENLAGNSVFSVLDLNRDFSKYLSILATKRKRNFVQAPGSQFFSLRCFLKGQLGLPLVRN